MAAEAGQVSLHFLNTSGAQRVAPFGGSDRRLSTNPMAVGIPLAGGMPTILDITTSAVAEGKLMVARNKGEKVPPGWIVDRHGQPTDDPDAFYDGGALLTIGAHKGSGLSIVTDLLAGAVTTGRSSDPDDTVLRNNMLSIYIDPSLYDREGAVLLEAQRLVDYVKASPPLDPRAPVLAPGEIERQTRATRLADGIPLDARTLADLVDAAALRRHRRPALRGAVGGRLSGDARVPRRGTIASAASPALRMRAARAHLPARTRMKVD